jgi:3-deoxy-D-manno-octulosonate 8-phosphate phosphatase (KDO 8-P phosphatase)
MKITRTVRERLAAIRALVFDVDGVLTEGQIIYSDAGTEAKAFDVKDGLGIRVAAGTELQIALMTGRASSVVQRRARDLRVQYVLQRLGDKAAALRAFAAQIRLPLERVAFMGDDLNDREALRIAGLSIAPADAAAEIRQMVDLVTDAPGGRGAAREAVEAILRAQGRWEQAVEQYLESLAERERARREEEGRRPSG